MLNNRYFNLYSRGIPSAVSILVAIFVLHLYYTTKTSTNFKI
nr:MAG TPA: hypothetical protein [Caudoviricetes sp.]